MKNQTRRNFIKKTTLGTAAVMSSGFPSSSFAFGKKIIGANDRINCAVVGVRSRGKAHVAAIHAQKNSRLIYNCDVDDQIISEHNTWCENKMGYLPKVIKDYRRLLEEKDVDIIFIATPEHWHAPMTIMAMQAGKHVYVEKPLTITIQEGREMINVQKKYGKVCSVGLNRRGSPIYQELSQKVQEGIIGKVTTARAQRTSNMFPNGIGIQKPAAPPKDFDWNMWLGPRAFRPYQYNMAPYFFRWWKEYSSQMGNWGVHYMDVIRWMLGESAPVAITATGGKYAVQDDRNIPDTMEVLFEMPSKAIIKFSIHEANGSGGITGGEVELNGSKGNLIASQKGYEVTSSRSGQFQSWDKLVEHSDKKLDDGSSNDSTVNLIRNFLDCIKTGQEPICTLEDGHRSTSFAHLANISLELGQRIEWDPIHEKITNNEKANDFLHYEYRAPWKL